MGASLLSSPLKFFGVTEKVGLIGVIPPPITKTPLFSAIKTLPDAVLTKITTLKPYNMWKICTFAKKL